MSAEAAVEVVAPPVHGHGHDWSLRDVTFEDSGTIEEFVCLSCGEVTYR